MVWRVAFGWRLAIVLVCGFGLTFRDHSLVYFTVQSNLVVLGYYVGALYWMRRRAVADAPAPRLRDALTYWILITGLVSHVLLEKWANPLPGLVGDPDLFSAWAIFAVHYLVPGMVLADWLALPPRQGPAWSAVPVWMAYPLGYALLALARAAVYPGFPTPHPYYFLDPTAQGYGWVAGQIGVLVVEFAVLAALLVGLGRLRARRVGQAQPVRREAGDEAASGALRAS